METAEVVVGGFLRRVVAVDDAADVVALEDLSLVVALLPEALDEVVGVAHGDVAGQNDAEALAHFLGLLDGFRLRGGDGVALEGVALGDRVFDDHLRDVGILDLDLARVRVFRHHAEEDAVVEVADGALHHLGLAGGQGEDEDGDEDGGDGDGIADPRVFDADEFALIFLLLLLDVRIGGLRSGGLGVDADDLGRRLNGGFGLLDHNGLGLLGLRLDGRDLERAETVEGRGEDAGLAGGEDVVAVFVECQHADVVELVAALVLHMLTEFVHLVVDALEGFGVADVVGLDVGLYEQRVVDVELRIEPERAQRGQEHAVPLVVARLDMMRHKTSQTWDNDAVVAQQKYLNMSFKFNHVCKITAFF